MKVRIKQDGKKKEFNLIKKWEDVTLDRWVKLINHKGKTKSADARVTIEALSDIPATVIDKLDLATIVVILNSLATMQKSENSSLREIIEIEGKEYGFHPDLDSITLGEFADLETYMQDMEKNLPEIMAVLFRPIVAKEGDYYQIEAYDGEIKLRAEVMRKISAEKVQDALVFFYNFGEILLLNMASSSIKLHRETIQR